MRENLKLKLLNARLGLLAQPLPGWNLQAEAGWQPGLLGDRADRRFFSLGQQWTLTPSFGLRLGARALWLGAEETRQLDLRLVHYF